MQKTKFMIVLLAMLLPASLWAQQTYQEPQAFIQQAFGNDVPDAKVLWLTEERQAVASEILGHAYASLRVRYWQRDKRTVWILDEIGKEKAITTGIIINQGKIEQVKVLVFRESRGWEVRNAFFTDQFKGVTLTAEKNLDRHIDGISGATLSVRALQKLARLALWLDQEVQTQDVAS